MKLSDRHRKLVDAFFKHDCNKSRALNASGYNDHRVFDHPNVVAEIERRQKISSSVNYNTEEKVIDFWNSTMDNAEMPNNVRLRASENLAKHLGMFTEKIEVAGEMNLIERIIAARQR